MTRHITSPDEFDDVSKLLKAGGVIVYPTETVYGIGCLPSCSQSITRLAELKGSPPAASYLILIGDMDQMGRYCSIVSERATKLIHLFWPGPLTLILPARESVHPRLLGSSGGVAVRWSSHPWVQALLRKLDDGLISTSANPSGRPAPRTLAQLDKTLARNVDMILDAGGLEGGISTVLDLCQDPPLVRREGSISVAEIGNVVSAVV